MTLARVRSRRDFNFARFAWPPPWRWPVLSCADPTSPSTRVSLERIVPLHPGPTTVRACSGPPRGSTQKVVPHGFVETAMCSRTLWCGRATTKPLGSELVGAGNDAAVGSARC